MSAACEDLLRTAAGQLREVSYSARLDAELLLAAVIGCSRLALICNSKNSVAAAKVAQFEAFVARRRRGEPVAYILGRKEFFGRSFEVSEAVLVPRPETEELVAAVIAAAGELKGHEKISILDLGTGSGCIAVTLALELGAQVSEMVAVDISAAALEVARQNATAHGVTAQVELLCGDLFAPVLGRKFDIVVSNPPYIREGDPNVGPELQFEPGLALYSGVDGLDVIRRIRGELKNYLKPGGKFIVEFGAEQAGGIRKLFADGIEIRIDLAGRDRIGVFTAPGG